MTTKYIKFTGKAKWAKVYDWDEFRGAKNWSIDLYLDDKQLAIRRDSGIQSKEYEDEDGKFVKFKRPVTKLINNVLNEFHGPNVYNTDGTPIVTYENVNNEWVRIGEPILIGNGSEVEVTVAVYDTQMGKGQRLESVKILDLITFNPEGSGTPNSIARTSNSPSGVKTPWN